MNRMATNKKQGRIVKSMASLSMEPRRLPNARMVQNFCLIWLDRDLDKVNNDDCRSSITQLRQVINGVDTFIDVDECIDFITNTEEGKIFLMVSEALSQIIVPVVQDNNTISTYSNSILFNFIIS